MKNTAKYAWSFSRNSSFLRGLFYYAAPCRSWEIMLTKSHPSTQLAQSDASKPIHTMEENSLIISSLFMTLTRNYAAKIKRKLQRAYSTSTLSLCSSAACWGFSFVSPLTAFCRALAFFFFFFLFLVFHKQQQSTTLFYKANNWLNTHTHTHTHI